ncbi:hypothetical protein ACI78R_18235 [Geodermatophilus sp. SYSU D01106]
MSAWHWLLVCWLTPGVLTLALLTVGALVRRREPEVGDLETAVPVTAPATAPPGGQPVAA